MACTAVISSHQAHCLSPEAPRPTAAYIHEGASATHWSCTVSERATVVRETAEQPANRRTMTAARSACALRRAGSIAVEHPVGGRPLAHKLQQVLPSAGPGKGSDWCKGLLLRQTVTKSACNSTLTGGRSRNSRDLAPRTHAALLRQVLAPYCSRKMRAIRQLRAR